MAIRREGCNGSRLMSRLAGVHSISVTSDSERVWKSFVGVCFRLVPKGLYTSALYRINYS